MTRFEEALKSAIGGDPGEQSFLGNLYQNGDGVTQDDELACYWYRKSAEQGDACGQLNLAWMYHEGRGIIRDLEQELYWTVQSAENGFGKAQLRLGMLHMTGGAGDVDKATALSWWLKAAEQGLADAQENVGMVFESGDGVAQDYGKAFCWYQKAANQGAAKSQNNLGVMYSKGLGVEEDEASAIRWFSLAADGGHPVAQANLDRMKLLIDSGIGEKLRLVSLVEKKENSRYGAFANINNDLGAFIELNEECEDLIKMAYGYARRFAVAGLYAQGVSEKDLYDHVFLIFKGLQISTGQSVKFQEEAAEQAIEMIQSYTPFFDNEQLLKFMVFIVDNGFDISDLRSKKLTFDGFADALAGMLESYVEDNQ